MGRVKASRIAGPKKAAFHWFQKGWAEHGHWAVSIALKAPKLDAALYTIAAATGGDDVTRIYVDAGEGKIGADTDLEIRELDQRGVPLRYSRQLGSKGGKSDISKLVMATKHAVKLLKSWGLTAWHFTEAGTECRVQVPPGGNEVVVIAAVALAKHLAKAALKGPSGPPATLAPNELKSLPKKERTKVKKAVEAWRRDPRLREQLERWWEPACAGCGVKLEGAKPGTWEYQAAHLRPVHEGQSITNEVMDVVPLCHNHHWALDQLLWAVDPETREIVKAAGKSGKPILDSLTKKLALPRDPSVSLPSEMALQRHWTRFRAAEKRRLS